MLADLPVLPLRAMELYTSRRNSRPAQRAPDATGDSNGTYLPVCYDVVSTKQSLRTLRLLILPYQLRRYE